MVPQKVRRRSGESRRSFIALYAHRWLRCAGVEIKVVDDARKTLPPGYEVKKPRVAPMCLWGILMNLNNRPCAG